MACWETSIEYPEAFDSDADGDYTITDNAAAKKYAITSYLKLLTARVLRLEEEMARHKKVSVIMYDDGKGAKKANDQ